MKYKFNFISNSSSSSFVCDLCGRQETGWDASPEELGFVRCVNGHLMCDFEVPDDYQSHLIEDHWGDSAIPEAMCPICSFEVSSKSDMKRHLIKVYGISEDVVFDEVKKINKRRKKLYDVEYVQYVYELPSH